MNNRHTHSDRVHWLKLTKPRIILTGILALHVIVSFYYTSCQNITFDEPGYIEYAKRWLHGHPDRVEPLDDSKSPVVAVAWVPRIVRQLINPQYQLHDYGRKDQKEGRYMMILFSLMIAVYVYWWCKELYGEKGWWLPLLLLLFDPLYLAYSTLITTDLACGAFLLAIIYHYRKYLVLQSQKHFYLAALFTGIGIVTKQALIFCLLLLPLLSIAYHLLKAPRKKINFKKSTANAVLFVLIILLVINTAYYFRGSFTPFGNYVFQSHVLQSLQQHLSFLKWLPMPLPHSYIQSVDMLTAHAAIGAGKPESTFNGIYLFGNLKLSGTIWYYYLVLLFYKMPVGIMLLFLCCIPLIVARYRRIAFAEKYLFLLLPIVFFWFILSFFNQFQSGIRHLLLVFPLLYIGLGYLLQRVSLAQQKYKFLTAAAIVYAFISIACYYPYIIPYTNEFISNKKTVYKKIWDSSVDYGQSDSSINSFIANHPGYKRAVAIPDTGKYAVLAGEMMNTYLRNDNQYKWYQAFEPKGSYRYVVLLFDIKKEDIDKADWKKTMIRIVP